MKKEKPTKIISSKKNPKTFIFIMKCDGTQDTIDLVKLRHPRTDEGCYFAVTNTVQEVLKFTDEKRSYFIDDSVASDGSLYLSVPIDPLFLVLPYLMEQKHCCPLEQILVDEEYPNVERLLNCDGMKDIHHIGDRKGDITLNAYIYNEEKTLIWLKKKVHRTATVLKNKGIHVSLATAISANFVKSEKLQDDEESYLKYALGLVGEYLKPELVTRVAEFMNLPPEENKPTVKIDNGTNIKNEKRKGDDVVDDHDEKSKKLKVEEEPLINSVTPPAGKPEKKISAKTEAMAKAAKGSKNISSFFKKK